MNNSTIYKYTPKKSLDFVLKTFNFQKTGKMARFDIIHNLGIVEYCTGVKPTKKNLFYLIKKTCDELLDLTFLYPESDPEKKKFTWNGFIFQQDWWTSWIIKRPFSDLKGLKEYVLREIEELNNWKSGESWDWWMKWYVEDYRVYYIQATKPMRHVTTIYAVSPVALDVVMHRAGVELFWYLYYDDPDLVKKWLDSYINHEIMRINDIADVTLCPIALVDCDIAYKNGLIASPEFLKKEFFPRLKKIIETWHKHNYKVIYHSDGFVWNVMGELIKAGIDAIHPIDVTSGMNIIKLREEYPNLVLIGGIDSIGLLALGTPRKIEKEIVKIITTIGQTEGIFLGSSIEIDPSSKLENIISIDKTLKKFRLR